MQPIQSSKSCQNFARLLKSVQVFCSKDVPASCLSHVKSSQCLLLALQEISFGLTEILSHWSPFHSSMIRTQTWSVKIICLIVLLSGISVCGTRLLQSCMELLFKDKSYFKYNLKVVPERKNRPRQNINFTLLSSIVNWTFFAITSLPHQLPAFIESHFYLVLRMREWKQSSFPFLSLVLSTWIILNKKSQY